MFATGKHLSFLCYLISLGYCEWVEVQVVNKEIENGSYAQSAHSNYETLMKPPLSTDNLGTSTLPPSNKIFNYTQNFVKESSHEKIYSAPTKNTKSKVSNMPLKNVNGFSSYLIAIEKNLLNYNGKTLPRKLKVLQELRDQLLGEIQNRITNLWSPHVTVSEARTYKDDDYHVDYPSNEGALMTIGFLTFAVFLIKLVLKLIYLLKQKKQYYFTSTTTTTAASVFLKKRDISRDYGYSYYDVDNTDKILEYIDYYKY